MAIYGKNGTTKKSTDFWIFLLRKVFLEQQISANLKTFYDRFMFSKCQKNQYTAFYGWQVYFLVVNQGNWTKAL